MGPDPVGVVFLWREDTDTHREKTMRRHREKTALYKPRREGLEETNPANILISDYENVN